MQDYYSQLSGLDCSDLPDLARQEMKDETDVNRILERYGVNAPQRPMVYGEIDYDLDLQSAKAALHDAQRAYTRLPEKIKDQYGSWQELLTAIQAGTFTMPDQETPKDVPPPTNT